MSDTNQVTRLDDRYQLGEELGRGGMGTVYRAYDPTLEREVAVKMLSELALGTQGRERLLHEAKAVAKLSHPNIVTVYDAGETDQTPYIVMEMIEGASLHDQPPADLPDIVDVANQVCAALEHAHQHGIVHRDLKPENVLIEEDGTAKLMDFGIARSMASRLTSEGAVAGTVFYLAPEIALGQDFDGRADLYSLGVMLYELTTGSLPFADGDPVAVISQHIHSSVVPPRAKNPEIPPLLDALITQLLAKSPDSRPTSAAETRKLLERSDLLDPAATEDREVLVLDRIVRGRFVGREQELSEARSVWNRAVSGQGQTLLISGEPGVGKTRLMRELSTHVDVSGGRSLIGACYPEGGAPYAPFAQIVRRVLQQNGHGFPEFVMADLLEVAPDLKPYHPNVAPNPPLDPEAAQQRLFENVVTFCDGLSGERPLLLVLDDVHWADSGSLALMRHLSRRIRSKPILLLATYREIELDEARPFREVLLELNRERLARRLKLGRLTQEQTKGLLTAIFEEEITPEFLHGIYRETEGNPFFIEEICKDLVESGKLFYRDGSWHRPSMDELQLPQSVRDVVQVRVSKLSSTHRDALTLAAILGREFDFNTLAAAAELGESTLIEALEHAEDAQLISEISGEGGATFSFVHALIPTTLVESVRTLRRRKLHRQAAGAIEQLRPEAYEELAYHSEEAGDDDRARKYYAQAGRRASKAYANSEAETSFRAALELNPSEDEMADVLAELAVVLARQGSYEQAIDAWKRGAALYSRQGSSDRVAWCYARMARASWDAGDVQQELELAEEGIAAVGEPAANESYADLLHELSRAYFFNGRSNEGIPAVQRALEIARSSGSMRVVTEALATQGAFLAAGDSDQLEAGQIALEEAIELAQAHDLHFQESRAHNNIATIVGRARGDNHAAWDHLKRASELNRLVGSIDMELFTAAHAAQYGIGLGELTVVESELDRLEALIEGMIDPGMGATSVRKTRHILNWARGHTREAVEGLRPIQAEARESSDLQTLWEISDRLAEALLELSEFEEALKAAQEGVDVTELYVAGKGETRARKAIALAKLGRTDEARAVLNEAKDLLPIDIYTHHAIDVGRAEAHLAVGEARWSDAWLAFEQVSLRMRETGMRLDRARVLREWAEGHLQRGQSDDLARAQELLAESKEEFMAMGSTAYVERIEAQLDEIGGFTGSTGD